VQSFGLNDAEPNLSADTLYYVEGIGYMSAAMLARINEMYEADPNLTGLGDLGSMLSKAWKKAGKNIKTVAHNIGEATKAAIKKPTLGNIFKAVIPIAGLAIPGLGATGMAVTMATGSKKGQKVVKEAAVITAEYGPIVAATAITVVTAGLASPLLAAAGVAAATAITTTESVIKSSQAATAQKDEAKAAEKEAKTLTAQAAELDKQTAALQAKAPASGATTSKTWLYIGLGAAVLVAVGAMAAARRK